MSQAELAIHERKDTAIAEQFEDAEQQREASTLGMWIFLATEILFFGALFVAYTFYRVRWPQAFLEGSRETHLWIGGINTAVLLTSSFFMAAVVHHAQIGDNTRVFRLLGLVSLLGILFLGLKAIEYYKEYKEGLVPGVHWSTAAPDEGSQSNSRETRLNEERLFFILYFIMTGIHAVHVTVGIVVMLVLMYLTRKRRFSANYYTPIDLSALYWHFVDIVWVFLYPAIYLLRQS